MKVSVLLGTSLSCLPVLRFRWVTVFLSEHAVEPLRCSLDHPLLGSQPQVPPARDGPASLQGMVGLQKLIDSRRQAGEIG